MLAGASGCGHYTLTLLNLGVGTHAASNSCLRPARAGSNVFLIQVVCIPLLVCCCCCCCFFCLVWRKRRRKAWREAKERRNAIIFNDGSMERRTSKGVEIGIGDYLTLTQA